MSIGATLFSAHETGSDNIIKRADIAMYQAKTDGRNIIRFYDPKMQEIIANRVNMERELRQAIEQQQFQLYYQIQVDSSGHPLGAEAPSYLPVFRNNDHTAVPLSLDFTHVPY